jgi:outer membrane protein assembly factor BamE (lipoprotein component of BamABCDE complex)
MVNRRLLMVAVLVTLVLLGVSAWALWPREQSAITRANAEKIQVGMTLAEVQTILGGPPRMEGSLTRPFGWNLDAQQRGAEVAVATHTWIGLHAKVEVGVNGNGRVISLSTRHPADDDASLFDSFRRRFGL